jgi:hypothetical protein
MTRCFYSFFFAAACALVAGCGAAPDFSDAVAPPGKAWVGANSNSVASGPYSTAEGDMTIAEGHGSHAEGVQNAAVGNATHVEGAYCIATGIHSHAEGQSTRALAINAHAENYQTTAGAKNSHAGGMWADALPNHTNAFIHATGRKDERKLTKFPNTAHFDRVFLFETANDDPHSVLARWQNDMRYEKIGGGDGLAKGVGNRTMTNTAFVGGGYFNVAGGFGTYIGGGMENFADGDVASVAGGWLNRAPGWGSTVGGGGTNIASGSFATVPGGRHNTAAGDYSFAAGQRAQALHNGSFVWADHQDADFRSSARDQFLVRAANGVGINTEVPQATLDVNGDARFSRGIRFPAQGDISMGIFTNGPR